MGHIGQSVLRVEDERLLRGHGRYLSELKIPGTLEAVFVRSTQAHATINRLDVEIARRTRDVVAVFTAADLAGRTEPLCVSGEVHTPERLQRVGRRRTLASTWLWPSSSRGRRLKGTRNRYDS